MESKKRPTFLTILCILTFVSTGWNILSKTISFATGAVYVDASQQLEDARIEMEDSMEEVEDAPAGIQSFVDGLLGQAEEIVRYQVELTVNDLILNVVILLGAIFMFQMQRRGYFLYIFGCVLQLIVPMIIAGYIPMLFYPVLFINLLFGILYSTQLKHLR